MERFWRERILSCCSFWWKRQEVIVFFQNCPFSNTYEYSSSQDEYNYRHLKSFKIINIKLKNKSSLSIS